MKLIMASVLLLAMLAFQPTLIYGAKNLASARSSSSDTNNNNKNRNVRSSKYGKRHSAEPLYSPALPSSSAKLVMSMESGDVLVRAARGAVADNQSAVSPAGNTNSGADGGKRQKNNNNKKLNKTLSTHEGVAATSTSSTTFGGRKRLEKKLSSTQHQPNNRGNNKQRQILKSQNHDGKRSGGKPNKEIVEKLQSESEKPSTTCRYAKSAWTECDPKTNMRSRTLTLKKGEPNCLPTRNMQKKCKKSCRYEKGAWSECTNGQMMREDKLKATGGVESSCEAVRKTNKKCNPNNGASKQVSAGGGKKERKNKEKGSRRAVLY